LQVFIVISGLSSLAAKFREFAGQAEDIITQVMLDSANENIIVVAKSLAPKKTGQLAGSIEAIPGEKPMQILIRSDRFYARFLEYGTKAHLIVPRNAKSLHWVSGDVNYFAKSVQNPGIEQGKFSFIGPAIAEGIEQLVRDVLSIVERELS
jgi:hypothetical protein